MADLYPGLALGDALNPRDCQMIPCKCESAVTKGQLVIFHTHTAGEIPSVATAGALGTNVLGIAMKSGGIGDIIPVGRRGIFKVKGSGAITGGVLVVADVTGQVQTIAANTFEKVVGRAIQTFGAGENDGLVDLGYP